MTSNIRILVVGDDITDIILLKRLLLNEGFEVNICYNGFEAYDEFNKNFYEIVITDSMMPKVGGVDLVKLIRTKQKKQPFILMFSTINKGYSQFNINEIGADEYLTKPIDKVKVLEKIHQFVVRIQASQKENNLKNLNKKLIVPFVAVGVAASTGGPQTVIEFFQNMKADLPASYFLVQHGPPWMLESFTQRLSNETKFKAFLGKLDIKPEINSIYVAPGDYHMVFQDFGFNLTINSNLKENFVRPAADPLFRSIATKFQYYSIGVVLTGLGKDGMKGSREIIENGGAVFAQNPTTCVAPSMPQSVLSYLNDAVSVDLTKMHIEVEKQIIKLKGRF